VVDYTAVWCGPCKAIAPTFETLATENPDIDFLKVDVDELEVFIILQLIPNIFNI
jgi:thioredoxin 1